MKLFRRIPFVGIIGLTIIACCYLLRYTNLIQIMEGHMPSFAHPVGTQTSVLSDSAEDKKLHTAQLYYRKLPLVPHIVQGKLDLIHSELNKTRSEAITPAFQIRKYLMLNSQICQGVPTVDVIIIVHTRQGNFGKRQRMRQTFANKVLFLPFQVRIVFLLGRPKDTDWILIESEHFKYKDTIIGDFDDTYHNLTLKGVMGFHWVSQYCPNSRFVLKIDDDVVIDMFNLLTRYIDNMKGKTRSIFCNVWKKNMMIMREGKWKVPRNQFNKMTLFPYNYCSGFTVLLTSDLMGPLYEAATITPFFWVDDIYLFGMLPRVAGNITYHNYALGQNLTLQESEAIACWDKQGHDCSILSLSVSDRMYWAIWERIKKLHSHSWQAESIFEA